MKREIIFTGSRGAEKYRIPLKKKGIQSIECPLIKVHPLSPSGDLKHFISNATVLVFTSINGIIFFKQMLSEKYPNLKLSDKDFWTVGTESKNALNAFKKRKHKVYSSKKQHGQGLAEDIINFYGDGDNKSHQRVILFQGRQAGLELLFALKKKRHSVTRLEIYDTKKVKTLENSTGYDEKIREGSLVHLASPSAVEALVNIFGVSGLKKCSLIAIGPTTAEKMSSCGVKPSIVLHSPDLSNTIREVEKFFYDRTSNSEKSRDSIS